jgi:hypothetical protein
VPAVPVYPPYPPPAAGVPGPCPRYPPAIHYKQRYIAFFIFVYRLLLGIG